MFYITRMVRLLSMKMDLRNIMIILIMVSVLAPFRFPLEWCFFSLIENAYRAIDQQQGKHDI